jgi:hypothetical protein
MSRGLKSSLGPLVGVLAVGAVLLTTPAATARPLNAQQQQAQPPSGEPQLLTSSQVDDKTLEQFTRSYLDVTKIQQKMKDDLANEKDPAKADQIKKTANQAMAKSVSDHQLTIDKFNQILASIPKDQDLGKRFVAMQAKVQQ